MAEAKQERFPDYPIFKGLQRPLEFFGLQGRYIYWAAATAGGAVAGFILGYCIFGSWQDSCCLSSPWLSVAFSSS